jgi:hypothetical protein
MKSAKLRSFIGAALVVAASIARAESWEVSVSLGYVDRHRSLHTDIPVMSAIVSMGKCVDGLSRTEKMLTGPVKVTQHLCVDKAGDVTTFTGWVFASKRIADPLFEGERGALNYGQPLTFSTDGNRVSFTSGHYRVTAIRNMSF